MEYDEFELQLGPVLGERLHVRVLRSPAGAGESLVPLAPILELASGLPRSSPATAGTALFQALFKAEVGELFHASLRGIGDDSGMRLRLAQDIEVMMARARIQKTSPAMLRAWITIPSPGPRARPRGREGS